MYSLNTINELLIVEQDKQITTLKALNNHLADDNLILLSKVEPLETQLANAIPKERVEALIISANTRLSWCLSKDVILKAKFKYVIDVLTPLLSNQSIKQDGDDSEEHF